MVKPTPKQMITTDEAPIMLLEQKNDDIHRALIRLENGITHLIDSHFKWVLGFMLSGFLGDLGLMARGFHML